MRATHTSLQNTTRRSVAIRYRFNPVMDLMDGTPLGTVCEMSGAFEDRATFGPAVHSANVSDSAKWLSDRLIDIASAVHADDPRHRPILVPAPVSTLRNPNTAVACDAAIRRTILCQQEICLEFSDATIASEGSDSVRYVAELRKRGFRVAIDMRKTWQTAMSDALRLLIDTIRIDARLLRTEQELIDICEAASAAGILVVAENAKWRQGDELAEYGIKGAVAPQTDA